MADENASQPDWAPNFFPTHGTLKYASSVLQLFVLLLAAGWLLTHILRGRISTAATVAAGG